MISSWLSKVGSITSTAISGFSTGAIVTLCGALILGVYLVISKYTRKEKKGCMLTDGYYEQI